MISRFYETDPIGTPSGFDEAFIAEAISDSLGFTASEGVGAFDFDFGRTRIEDENDPEEGVFTLIHDGREFTVTVTEKSAGTTSD